MCGPCACVPEQDQHKLLSQYQALVVKQLVSQGAGKKAEQDGGDGQGEEAEAEAIHKELLSLTAQVKDLVLSQKKNSVTEE